MGSPPTLSLDQGVNQKLPRKRRKLDDFANTDPKDKGNRKVKYRDRKDFTKGEG